MRFSRVLVLVIGWGIAACSGGGGAGNDPPRLVSIAVTTTGASVEIGTDSRFTATGTYSDGTTRDLTSVVTWSSAGDVSEPITTAGVMTATAVGATRIVAAYGSVSGSIPVTVTSPGNNVLAITVNGALCSPATSAHYPNKACVAVTVCTPGTTQCTTVNDILLDTGSVGLRIFKSALGGLPLAQAPSGSGALAECIETGHASLWGPVQFADVKLGNEPAVRMPIQVIDATFGGAPAGCANPAVSPADAHLTGILGVGLFLEDCGDSCSGSHADNNLYFSCVGSSCRSTAVEVDAQVKNPVGLLPTDNNGLIVKLPPVPPGGLSSLTGQLVLGIGTQADNVPGPVTVIKTSPSGTFTTIFNGVTYPNSFLDTGSNGIFFGDSSATGIPLCSDRNWYCPPSTLVLSATILGSGGGPSLDTSFRVGNYATLAETTNTVFGNLAGSAPGTLDWGLPFFYGKEVLMGLDHKSSGTECGAYFTYINK